MRSHFTSPSTLSSGNSVYSNSYLQGDARRRHLSPAKSGSTTTSLNDVCDRTVVRVRRSGFHHERIRVVCTTRRQHVSRLVTVSDVCHTLPPLRKHVTIVRLAFIIRTIITLYKTVIRLHIHIQYILNNNENVNRLHAIKNSITSYAGRLQK